VLAAVDWDNLTVAGAFVLGAVLAALATIRVTRAVAIMFGGEIRRARRPRRDDTPPPDPPAPG
jgi:hypothetical protein